MSEEIHAQLLSFLGEAFARQGHRQAVKVSLLYCPPKSREEPMRSWDRETDGTVFERLDLLESLIRTIIESSETLADANGIGTHQFKVKVFEHLGGTSFSPFRIKPSYDGTQSNDLALPNMGGQGNGDSSAAMAILSQNNGVLLRVNQQMFDSSFRTLANLTENMRAENNELRLENQKLRKELEEAQSNKLDREYQLAMAADKNARTNRATEKLLQLGTVIAARITGTGKELGVTDGLQMLLMQFGKSLRPDQLQKLMTVLDQGQLAMFVQIMEMIPKGDAPPQGGGAPPQQNPG